MTFKLFKTVYEWIHHYSLWCLQTNFKGVNLLSFHLHICSNRDLKQFSFTKLVNFRVSAISHSCPIYIYWCSPILVNISSVTFVISSLIIFFKWFTQEKVTRSQIGTFGGHSLGPGWPILRCPKFCPNRLYYYNNNQT